MSLAPNPANSGYQSARSRLSGVAYAAYMHYDAIFQVLICLDVCLSCQVERGTLSMNTAMPTGEWLLAFFLSCSSSPSDRLQSLRSTTAGVYSSGEGYILLLSFTDPKSSVVGIAPYHMVTDPKGPTRVTYFSS